MKKIILLLILAALIHNPLKSQEITSKLNEAHTAYSSGNLQETRFTLQQSLHEIDMVIGAEILKILPVKMGNMQAIEDEDDITATSMGFTGLYVNRKYGTGSEENQSASIQIITDSPLLTGISAMLALPIFGSDPDQKRIRVGSYRALLQRSQDATKGISWDVQIPIGNTLVSFNCTGIEDEKNITELVNTIPLDQIANFTR